jgi:hypothetical protein
VRSSTSGPYDVARVCASAMAVAVAALTLFEGVKDGGQMGSGGCHGGC